MSSSHWSNHKVADKWRLGCCRGATSDEKGISFRLRLREIFAAFQPFKGLTRYSRRPSPEDILKCCICASARPVVGNVHDRMPALLREMDFLRWLSGNGDTELRFDEDGAGGDRGEAGGVGYDSFARFFTIQQTRGRRGGQLDSTATKRSPFTRPSRPALPRRSRECRNTVRKKVTV